jgi:hypothetical protein
VFLTPPNNRTIAQEMTYNLISGQKLEILVPKYHVKLEYFKKPATIVTLLTLKCLVRYHGFGTVI